MEADRDFCHGMAMLAAARRCENWRGDGVTDTLTMAKLAGLAASYRERAFQLMTCAAQPIRANRTATTARDFGGETPC